VLSSTLDTGDLGGEYSERSECSTNAKDEFPVFYAEVNDVMKQVEGIFMCFLNKLTMKVLLYG
jgi:hypothetical protein